MKFEIETNNPKDLMESLDLAIARLKSDGLKIPARDIEIMRNRLSKSVSKYREDLIDAKEKIDHQLDYLPTIE